MYIYIVEIYKMENALLHLLAYEVCFMYMSMS